MVWMLMSSAYPSAHDNKSFVSTETDRVSTETGRISMGTDLVSTSRVQVITAREDILKWYLSLGYTATGIRAEFPESELWEVKGDRKLFFERIEKTLD